MHELNMHYGNVWIETAGPRVSAGDEIQFATVTGDMIPQSLEVGSRPQPQFDGGSMPPTMQAGNSHAVQLARATSYIEQNLGSHALTPQAVAEATHVSRSTLYRLFGGSGGVSRYIWQARLNHAWSALASPEEVRPIGQIAFDLGFLSEAHFCHAFRNSFGISPGSLRQACVLQR